MKSKQIVIAIMLVLGLVSLIGCSNPPENKSDFGIQDKQQKETTVKPTPTMDFDRISFLPKAEQKQSVEHISKLLFGETRATPDQGIVIIDLGNKAMYSNPSEVVIGIEEPDLAMTDADIAQLRSILVKYDVQSWNEDYSSKEIGYMDGFGWSLQFIYDDRTTEMHYGRGSTEADVIPDNYNEFVEELLAFAQSVISRQQ